MKKGFVQGVSFELVVYRDAHSNARAVNLTKLVVELKMNFWLLLFSFSSNVKKFLILKIAVSFLAPIVYRSVYFLFPRICDFS